MSDQMVVSSPLENGVYLVSEGAGQENPVLVGAGFILASASPLQSSDVGQELKGRSFYLYGAHRLQEDSRVQGVENHVVVVSGEVFPGGTLLLNSFNMGGLNGEHELIYMTPEQEKERNLQRIEISSSSSSDSDPDPFSSVLSLGVQENRLDRWGDQAQAEAHRKDARTLSGLKLLVPNPGFF